MKKDHLEIKSGLEKEIDNLNKKLTETQKTSYTLRQDKILLEEENAILNLEKEKIVTIKDSHIATLNEKVMKFEIELNKLNEINEFSKRRLEEYSPKVYKYDELYEKVKDLMKFM